MRVHVHMRAGASERASDGGDCRQAGQLSCALARARARGGRPVERSKGISIGCKRERGGCLWPDLAQREGVSSYCLVLSSGSLQLVFHSGPCQIPVGITANSQRVAPAVQRTRNTCSNAATCK